MEWVKTINAEGRPVYRTYLPKYGDYPVGSIVDYSPGSPPYRALVRIPWIIEEWFMDLDEAKQFVTTKIVFRLMHVKEN